MENKQYFGVMIDVSRNGIMKPQTIKKFVDYISQFGYNMLQLYTEDTYQVINEPYFGYMRGAYTFDELKSIDFYCIQKGVTLIPCIETLAHLNQIFKWKEYDSIHDTSDILLVDEEKTYQLIENMIKTVSMCFSSKIINLGMDEAHRLGLGTYLKKHGYKGQLDIFLKHLDRVVSICKKYGFEPLIWSDMLFESVSSKVYDADTACVSYLKSKYNNNAGLIYWEYFLYDEKQYAERIRKHKEITTNTWFAGGVHTWIGFAHNNKLTIDAMTPAMKACVKEGIKNILITLWDGSECSFFPSLASLLYIKSIYDGITDLSIIKSTFFNITGENYDAFMNLDLPNTCFKDYKNVPEIDFAKYVVYNDIFSGYIDTALTEGACKQCKKYSKYLLSLSSSGSFDYLYKTQAYLLDFMYYKHDLGIKLRKAYLNNDKNELIILSHQIKKSILSLKKFYKSFREMWMIENKPQGFEIQDIRLGGLIARLNSCLIRLTDYLNGIIQEIPELELSLLHFNGYNSNYLKWDKIVSVNTI